jgi:hypothetical protein
MSIRQITVASALVLAVLASAGSSALAQEAQAIKYCKADVARLCPGVPFGGGRILGCLKAHKMELSVGCAQGLQKMKAQMGK